MGSRRTVFEKAKSRTPTRHVWLYPTRSAVAQVQGLLVESTMREGEPWVRVVYVSGEHPPTVIDTWVPSRVTVSVESRPTEPNY